MATESLQQQSEDSAAAKMATGHRHQLALMLKNSLANLCRFGSNGLLVLVVPPFLIRHLSNASYSTWMLILQLTAYVTLVQGGIELAVSRYVARAEHTGERDHARRILGAAGLLLALFGSVLVTITVVASWKFEWLFPEIPLDLSEVARYALLIVGIAYSANLPFSILSGLFQGYQKFEATAIAVSLGKLVAAFGVIWTALHGGSLLRMAWWAAIGPFTQSLLILVWWQRDDNVTYMVPHRPDLQATREFFRFCASILIVQFATVLIAGLDLPIVAAFDFASAGYYAAATAAANVVAVSFSAIISTFVPVASGLVATRTAAQVGLVLTRASRYATALLCAIAFPLLAFMYPLLKLWIGQAYAAHTAVLASTLIVAQFVRLTLFPYAIVGFSAGQQERMLASPIAEGVVNLVVSLIAVRIWGAWGVAFGTLVGSMVGIAMHFLVSMPATDSVRVDRILLLSEAIFRPILISLPATLAAVFFAAQARELSVELLGFVATALVIMALHLRFTLNQTERFELREIASRYTRRLGIAASPAWFLFPKA